MKTGGSYRHTAASLCFYALFQILVLISEAVFMKRIIAITLCLMMLACFIASCGTPSAKGDKLSIVTTIFPEYDWVKQILGDKAAHADVVMLLDNGVDLHSYQPTADDIIRISTCDLFIYVGGESDEWVEDALKESTNKDMAVINLLEVLGKDVKEEEIKEGMQEEEHEHGDGHEDDHEDDGHDHEEETEYDEHVWLSLKKRREALRIYRGKARQHRRRKQGRLYSKRERVY